MNLTFELLENGYIILNDGVKWIEQKGFMPYPSDTLEGSAKNHIDALINDMAASDKETVTIAQLQEQVKVQEQAIMELSIYMATLGV